MITLTNKDKEFKLIPRTRKVVELTERLKEKNLNDLIFNGLNDGNIKVLAELIKAFAENADEKPTFSSLNLVYDFIDEWKSANNKTHADLYREVIGVVNEMGFFKTKMSEEEISKMMENPIPMIDVKELATNSAQKIMDEIAKEEFQGYKG